MADRARIRSLAASSGTALALVAAALLACSAPAVVKKPKRERPVVAVFASTQAAGSGPVTLEPRCPGRMSAVGGGWATILVQTGVPPGGFMTQTLGVVFESHRADPGAWRTSGVRLRNPSAPEVPLPRNTPWLTAWSLCKRLKGGGLLEVAATGSAAARPGNSSARASCPRKRIAFSGGFGLSGAPGPGYSWPSIYESFRSTRRSWTASVTPAPDQPASITTYAYCLKAKDPPLSRSRTLAGPGTSTSGPCPKRVDVHAGGFRFAGGSDGVIRFFVPALARGASGAFPGIPYRVGESWDAGVHSPAGLPLTLRTFGYCARPAD